VRSLLIASIWVCVGVGLRTQQKPAEQPTFKSGVELVTVDVTVVDGESRLVRDLKAEDFTVTVDDAPRRITSLQFIEQGARADAAATASPRVDAPPAFGSNEGAAAGRLIVLVPDLDNIAQGGGKVVFDTVAKFVDGLSPADRIALVPLGGGEPRVDFTADRGRIREALLRAVGRRTRVFSLDQVTVGIEEAIAIERGDAQTLSTVLERECLPSKPANCPRVVRDEARRIARDVPNEARVALRNLASLIDAFGKMEGSKSLVLLSEGFVYESSTRSEFLRVATAAARGRVAIYAMQLDSALIDASTRRAPIASAADLDLRAAGLDQVVDLARGTRFRVTATGAGVFDRLSSELSGYYLLSFEPSGPDRDGKTHRIDVKVRRPGVSVRGRREFAVGAMAGRAAVSPRDQVGALLRSPLPAVEVPLKVMAYSTRGEGSKVKLVIAAEIDRTATSPGAVSVGFELRDAKGRIAADSFEQITARPINLSRPSPRAHFTGTVVDPGSYTLVVAVVDDGNRKASAALEVDARLTSMGPLLASDLLIGATVEGAFRPRAEVRRGGRLTMYTELYAGRDQPAWETLEATVEIAPRAGAPALLHDTAKVQPTADPSRRLAIATLDTTTLSAGDYFARIAVTQGGQAVGEVTRTLRVVP
jgi:VWFA-related protein